MRLAGVEEDKAMQVSGRDMATIFSVNMADKERRRHNCLGPEEA